MSQVPKCIFLKGDWIIRKSGVALEAITPGMLVETTASGVQKASAAGGDTRKAFADFQDYVGKGIDTAYAADDTVSYGVCKSGDEVYAYVAANATAITFGAPLESDGLGGVRIHVATSINEAGSATKSIYAGAIVGYALEAVDNSAVASPTRIKMEVA